MKKTNLHIFLEILDQAVAILKVQEMEYYLVSLNDKLSVSKYNQTLEDMNKHAFFDHLSNLLPSNGDSSDYREALIQQLEEALSLIEYKDGIYTHKRLSIKDTEDQPHSYDEMPDKVKREISAFIEVQRNAIINFLDKIKNKGFLKVGDTIIYDIPLTEAEKSKDQPTEVPIQYPDEILAPGDQWLDNEKVCLLFNFTKRTLQTYRDNGTIPFSKIGYKFYYKASDIRNILDKNYNVSN